MITKKTFCISDLDGTLLNNNAELSDYARNTLNALITGGLQFTIATARTLASTLKILDGLKLSLPIILMNGVLIYDTEQQIYTKINAFSPQTVPMVIKTLRQFEITGFMYELKDGRMMTYHESLEKKPLRDFVEERISRYYKTFMHTEGFENLAPENIVYFTLLDTYENLLPVRDALLQLPGLKLTMYENTYNHDSWYLEVFSEKASKQNAVNHLREIYAFERAIGFGDNYNDLSMFEACDVKIAVENAKPELKASADFICDTNYNDGVVKWLEKNVPG